MKTVCLKWSLIVTCCLSQSVVSIRGEEPLPKPIQIEGKLSADDLEAIKKGVSEKSKKPILSIKVQSPDQAEVKTGFIRGPLEGSGEYFELKKKEGKWTAELSGRWFF